MFRVKRANGYRSFGTDRDCGGCLDGELAATLQGIDLPKIRASRIWYPNRRSGEGLDRAPGRDAHQSPILVHQDLARNRPDVVRAIYDMLVDSRELA